MTNQGTLPLTISLMCTKLQWFGIELYLLIRRKSWSASVEKQSKTRIWIHTNKSYKQQTRNTKKAYQMFFQRFLVRLKSLKSSFRMHLDCIKKIPKRIRSSVRLHQKPTLTREKECSQRNVISTWTDQLLCRRMNCWDYTSCTKTSPWNS